MKAEPHKIKTIRNLNITTYHQREVLLRDACYNTFNIPGNFVTYDMVSQGTSAKSQEQEAASLLGDEAYAGSRGFERLQSTFEKYFGMSHVCPTHNLLGSLKLIAATMVKAGDSVISNSAQPQYLLEDRKCNIIRADVKGSASGDFDKILLRKAASDFSHTAFIYIDLYADGYRPLSIAGLEEVKSVAGEYKLKLIINLSQVIEWAHYVRYSDIKLKNTDIIEIIKKPSLVADVCVFDAAQDARCNTGALIAAHDYEIYEKFMNEVTVYEGLHTYGGMSGRTMESFAHGLDEMVYEPQAEWISTQVQLFSSLLNGIPKFTGADGVYIKADEFLPSVKNDQANALAALLYLKAAIRCITQGKYNNETILPVQIPRLALTNDQIIHLARAINEVYKERDKLTIYKLNNEPEWLDEAEYSWNSPVLNKFNYDCEAYRITTIEYVGVIDENNRNKILESVGFNTFLLPSKDVSIDLLTDSGTCAQTVTQWSKFNEGEETPASGKDYFDMVEVLKDVTGYKYIIPTHQGRAAEHIMSQVLIKGGFVPGNMYFTTTKLHQEMAGGTFVDVICDEAHDPTNTFPWKGNIDIRKIQKIIDEHGEGCIPYISFEFSVNLAGGQPVSMYNAREVYIYCKGHHIPVMFDATRAVENAYMIKKKDPRYHAVPIKEILHELFSYGDGCTVSSKKDYLVNIGGFLGIRDDGDFYKKALSMLRVYEGTKTNGGMSAGDMAMHAEGVREMLDYNYIMARVEQTQYLGNKLLKAGIPIVEPIGTHAVFLDAKRFLPHIDQDNYPAQALAAELYINSGIRAMERGNVSSGRNKKTGKNYRPSLELVRLTIPRRAYTNAHMDLVADSIIELYKRRDTIKGLEFTYEPENLRFFQSKFQRVDKRKEVNVDNNEYSAVKA